MRDDIAVFKAYIPPIKSGILISGDGTGGSIKLEIPQVERAVFHQLMEMTNTELIVTIARAAPVKQSESDGTISTGTKRKSQWQAAKE